MLRLEWPVFEAALKTACGIAFDVLSVLGGTSAVEQDYVRKLLRLPVIDDLLAFGHVERQGERCGTRYRYSAGKGNEREKVSNQR